MTRLVVTLLVRDEADIVAATIEHHLRQGAARLIVTDNGSVDGTLEILREYEAAGVLDLLLEPRQDYRQSEWVTRMARRASVEHGADWVVNADADEFWMARDPRLSLTDALASTGPDHDLVEAVRDDLRALRTARGRTWLDRNRWRDLQTQWEDGTPLRPKVAHRGLPDVEVAQGNHDATAGGRTLSRSPEHPVDVLHLPLRSWSQFERKIRNGGSAYESNQELPPTFGWHWRQDYRRLQEGHLREDYERRLLGRRELLALRRSGRIRRERRLRDGLRDLLRTAVLPDQLARVLDGRPSA